MSDEKTNNLVNQMLTKIKELEPIVGKNQCKKVTEKTLKAQIKKGNITDNEYKDIISRLGYE